MELSNDFVVGRSRDEVVETLCREDVLLTLFPGRTEIIDRGPDRLTTKTQYTALGQEGEATFHWNFRMDGSIAFEKICDGRVWRELRGLVDVEEHPRGARVCIEMTGRTKSFVPEFTIKGPMGDQLSEMLEALQSALEV